MRTMLILAALLPLAACSSENGSTANNEVAVNQPGPVKGVDRSHRGQPGPDAAFLDPEGEEVTLADFEGQPVLLNLWASWCAPCVKELPTLDRLAASDSTGLKVLPISQDAGPHASVVAFLEQHKIAKLEPYQDPKMALSGALNAQVLPVSILFDANGQEVWRYVGDLDWTGPEAAKLLSEARGGRTSG